VPGTSFSHLDERGNARMIDVTGKPVTERRATARGRVVVSREARAEVFRDGETTAEVLAEARSAGILAAKRTSSLVPLCHPLLIGDVTVDLALDADGVDVAVSVETRDRTGVEMEALTGCLFAALTICERCRPRDPAVSVHDFAVWEKSGGRSGRWVRRSDGTVEHVPTGASGPASSTPG
jgi:cyclic pyranopterin phosphate synthase